MTVERLTQELGAVDAEPLRPPLRVGRLTKLVAPPGEGAAEGSDLGDVVSLLAFVGVAFQDRPSDAAEFLVEPGRSLETTYVLDDDSGAAIALGVRGVPDTVFIDAEEVIQGRIQGESDALLLAQTTDTVLAGDTPGDRVMGEV